MKYIKKLLFGTFAAAVFVATTLAALAAPQTVRLCTGAQNGIYDQAGRMIQQMAKGHPSFDVQIVYDTGGTWGNIQRTTVGNECDAFIGQPDGHALLKRQNEAQARMINWCYGKKTVFKVHDHCFRFESHAVTIGFIQDRIGI